MNYKLLNLILKESSEKKGEGDSPPKEMEEREHILVSMAKFIETLDDDSLDEESYEKIDIAFDALFDVIVSLDEEDLDSESDEEFIELMKSFDALDTVDLEEGVYKYKARKSRGKVRSKQSRLTGSAKLKMIKAAKAKRKVYKRSASLRLKVKKKSKKYRKSSKGRQTKRIYKSLNK